MAGTGNICSCDVQVMKMSRRFSVKKETIKYLLQGKKCICPNLLFPTPPSV